jgi:acetoin utilization deacetylase AcuC-like enzyme
MEKYKLIREKLLETGTLKSEELLESPIANPETVMLAHTKEYVQAVCSLTLNPKIVRRIGFPLTEDLVLRSLATVGGAIAASEYALEYGVSGNLAGGTHHALPDAGEGFCVFNDIATAILLHLQNRRIARAAIIDVDVHQGNGNSAILGDLPNVFIFSMHGEKNYPFHKVPSTIDINLPDNTQDEEYLEILKNYLPEILDFMPDIIFYLGGSDPLAQDSLGRLSLSMEGLYKRDQMVFQACKAARIPLSLALGGGYSKPVHHTVQAHVQTYQVLRQVYGI